MVDLGKGDNSPDEEEPVAPDQASTPLLRVRRVEQFHGPLPPPDALAQYEAVVPGSGERLLQIYERQVERRHRTETALVRDGAAHVRRGLPLELRLRWRFCASLDTRST